MIIEINLKNTELRAIASFAHLASSDDVTPVITGVHITGEANRLLIESTDRYVAGRLTFTPTSEPTFDDFEVNIPAKELSAAYRKFAKSPMVLLKIATSAEYANTVRYEFTDYDSVVAGIGIAGNYPPLARLFPSDTANYDGVPSASLNPSFIAKLAKIYHPADGQREKLAALPWKFHFKGTDSGRPNAVYVTRTVADYPVEVLIQPNLLK